jgi:predicted metal-dependent enzyme (double-stranded beta helix superfamily)
MNAQSAITPDLGIKRLTDFVGDFAGLVDAQPGESEIIARGGRLLADLVSHDDWLPDAYAAPDKERYRQYLLHLDPRERFSVVSFVWGPGQATPVHDHRTWGLIGVLRGAEFSEHFVRDAEGALRPSGPVRTVYPGKVEAVSPRVGDIHRVANAYDHKVSISIHVYGADIGKVERATFNGSGQATRFISGYYPLPVLVP